MSCMHGRIITAVLLLLMLLQGSSCESTSDIGKRHPPSFELTADKSEGTVADTITFTGRLYGDIGALVMCYPTDCCFCAHETTMTNKTGPKLASPLPETCICYERCDSTQSAKRAYVRTHIYERPGTYKASMKLICRNGTFFSDTVVVGIR